MSIFISHTTSDDLIAKKIFLRLTKIYHIKCYIDDIDKELENKRGKSSLTPLLVNRLRKCDTLLAVVTENTKGSWWVPFEIGTAREMPRVISSFTNLPDYPTYSKKQGLPEYFLEWPRLRTDEDLDIFANEYQRKFLLLQEGSESISFNNVRNFESNLMKSLDQRRY